MMAVEKANKSWLNILKGLASRGGLFPQQFAFTLLRRLELKEDYHVLEIGPGPGYFSLGVARAIPRGLLVLADIQQEMLDQAVKRLAGKGIKNIRFHLCNGTDFPFRSESFDVIFMVAVLGEIEDEEGYLSECFRLLRPGALLSISEQAGDADRMSRGRIRELARQAGFECEKIYGKERNFTMNFRKNAGHASARAAEEMELYPEGKIMGLQRGEKDNENEPH